MTLGESQKTNFLNLMKWRIFKYALKSNNLAHLLIPQFIFVRIRCLVPRIKKSKLQNGAYNIKEAFIPPNMLIFLSFEFGYRLIILFCGMINQCLRFKIMR